MDRYEFRSREDRDREEDAAPEEDFWDMDPGDDDPADAMTWSDSSQETRRTRTVSPSAGSTADQLDRLRRTLSSDRPRGVARPTQRRVRSMRAASTCITTPAIAAAWHDRWPGWA
jgi:hypothetical protein